MARIAMRRCYNRSEPIYFVTEIVVCSDSVGSFVTGFYKQNPICCYVISPTWFITDRLHEDRRVLSKLFAVRIVTAPPATVAIKGPLSRSRSPIPSPTVSGDGIPPPPPPPLVQIRACSLLAFGPRSLRILLGLSAIRSGILVLERSIAPRSNLGDVSARYSIHRFSNPTVMLPSCSFFSSQFLWILSWVSWIWVSVKLLLCLRSVDSLIRVFFCVGALSGSLLMQDHLPAQSRVTYIFNKSSLFPWTKLAVLWLQATMCIQSWMNSPFRLSLDVHLFFQFGS